MNQQRKQYCYFVACLSHLMALEAGKGRLLAANVDRWPKERYRLEDSSGRHPNVPSFRVAGIETLQP
jgi:hypothetical protein